MMRFLYHFHTLQQHKIKKIVVQTEKTTGILVQNQSSAKKLCNCKKKFKAILKIK